MQRPPTIQDAYAQNAQPMNWTRAFISGVFASMVLMSFIDICYMWDVTPFNLEVYIGSIFRDSLVGTHNWTIGFLVNLVMGGVFGLLYGFFFEDIFQRSGTRIGLLTSVFHIIFVAVAVFPFFGIVAEQLGTELFPHFGILGSGLGPTTPLILIVAHLLFGATMGLFYGPVRLNRLRAKFMEPEDSAQENTDAA
jgi:hypothetical protein